MSLIQSVVQTDSTELTVTFEEDLDLTGASLAALESTATWELTSDGTGIDIYVTAVEIVSSDTVKLTVTRATNGQPYTLEILSADAKTLAGTPLQGEKKSYTSVVDGPEVSSVEVVSSRLVLVTFDREVFRNPDLLDPAKYVFSVVEPIGGSPLTTLKVSRVTPTIVLVTTSTQDPNTVYDLTVNP